MINEKEVISAYNVAKAKYAQIGVNTENILEQLAQIPLSLHCWQGDDLGGFETPDTKLSGGGIQVTGNFSGKARNVEELRQDYLKVFSLIPVKPRANLHAIYGEFAGEKVDRNQITLKNFQGWIDWAKLHNIGIDFNATLFSHPYADSGFTLSSKDEKIRSFWIDHCIRCRQISAEIGKQLGTPCIHNLWIPDGSKDIPVDRLGHRTLLRDSLDQIYQESLDSKFMLDALEGKLFGIASEAFVVGSHDFYLSYTLRHNKILTLDMGHFHPTESVADKISAILPFTNRLMLHISRGIRWDSDHIVILNDEVLALAEELVRTKRLKDVYLGLDFFDASVNRLGAWVIGVRSTFKALLIAFLQPINTLRDYEEKGQNFQRLALLEELKSMPWGAVWDEYCRRKQVPVGTDWIADIENYERVVLQQRKN
ncbi:MAG: L-rhamnose isomerase [Promethearchaeota archaeon]|nr:MAG: L-rhamnose isomerase [Candidatus Lokiarchaeota archaeon]